MSITVNNRTIKVDREGFLLDPGDWNDDVGLALIKQHEREGHKEVTETGWLLIKSFRDFYDDHMRHPNMNELIREHAKRRGRSFEEEKHDYKEFLYELFPHGPIRMLAKLAGLPRTAIAQEITGG